MFFSYFLFSVAYIGPVKNLKSVAYISSLYRESVIWRLWDTDADEYYESDIGHHALTAQEGAYDGGYDFVDAYGVPYMHK